MTSLSGTAAIEQRPAPGILPMLDPAHHEAFEEAEFDHPCDDVSLAGALAVVNLYKTLGESWTSDMPLQQSASIVYDPFRGAKP